MAFPKLRMVLRSAIAVCVAAMASVVAYASQPLPETNLHGVSFVMGYTLHVSSPDGDKEIYIVHGNGEKEVLGKNYIALFVNGSLIKNANLVLENDRTLVPLRFISEELGASVDWDDAAKKVTITDGEDVIELVINDKNPKVNGEVAEIDVAPKIIGSRTFVPVRFVAETLRCDVGYFDGRKQPEMDGSGIPEAHYLAGVPQVMVSRYPEDAVALTSREAIEKARADFIHAYEKKYGSTFSLVPEKNMPAPDRAWEGAAEREWLAYYISNLKLLSENDRFYTSHMLWDILIDKYTGAVYTCNRGLEIAYKRFDPEAATALALAG